ncbi:MAG: hypothetical protein JRH20_19890 [Deltaproteobacteria bacterium]|nr:hypothetical protein [Deltaproteobacteria bacterium]
MAQQSAPRLNRKQKIKRLGATLALATLMGGALATIGPVYGAFGAVSTMLASKDVNRQILADAARGLGIAKKNNDASLAQKSKRSKRAKAKKKPTSAFRRFARSVARPARAVGSVIKDNAIFLNIPIGLSLFGLGVLQKDPMLLSSGATYSMLALKTSVYALVVRGTETFLRSELQWKAPERLTYPVSKLRSIKERFGLQKKQRVPRH